MINPLADQPPISPEDIDRVSHIILEHEEPEPVFRMLEPPKMEAIGGNQDDR